MTPELGGVQARAPRNRLTKYVVWGAVGILAETTFVVLLAALALSIAQIANWIAG
jgi:putative flippase GtrA